MASYTATRMFYTGRKKAAAAAQKKRQNKTNKSSTKSRDPRNEPVDKYGEPIRPEDRKHYTDDELYGVGKGPDDGLTEEERMLKMSLRRPNEAEPKPKPKPKRRRKKQKPKRKIERVIELIQVPRIVKKDKPPPRIIKKESAPDDALEWVYGTKGEKIHPKQITIPATARKAAKARARNQ